jgi:UDP-2-acetamido-3-amino-2,3-dideoxy-glucuronate N-acetyltransferase
MNENMKISVAVIGCGHWGKNLVRNFSEIGVLRAISDPSPQIQQHMTKTYNVPALSVDEILTNDEIDAVVIAVPAQLHHEIALKALKADKHVFVEKPITLTMEHAQELCDVASAKNKTLMVGHLLQYHPVFLKLKQMVRGGELGEIRYIYSRRLSTGKIRVHENVLWSFAPHDISMVLALAGSEPEKTVGFASDFLTKNISDFASVQMAFPNGVRAHIETSWLNPFKEQRLVVVGEKAMAEFDDQADWAQKLKLYRHKAQIVDGEPVLEKAEPEFVAVEQGEPLRNECEHFLKFCQTGETPYTDGKEAMAVLKVLQAGDASGNDWSI